MAGRRSRARRGRPRRLLVTVVGAVALALGGLAVSGNWKVFGSKGTPSTSTASGGAAGPGVLRAAVAALPVAAEHRAGYERTKFEHWVDADGDGCDTRAEVLIAEATTAPTVGDGCKLRGGRWVSYYDGRSWSTPDDLDIDHMVPLAEAWDSGAWAWDAGRRRAYANDLGEARALVAVTDEVNQGKGDQDPAAWMPPDTGVWCRYLGDWVAVQTRWRLTVDSAERAALTTRAAACPDVALTVAPAF